SNCNPQGNPECSAWARILHDIFNELNMNMLNKTPLFKPLFKIASFRETNMIGIRTRLASVLGMTAAVAALTWSGGAAAQSAEVMERLAKGAVENGKQITWYESSPEDQISKVLAAFNK